MSFEVLIKLHASNPTGIWDTLLASKAAGA